jgi:hypothetical protein
VRQSAHRRRISTRPPPLHHAPPLVVLCDISGSMARYAQIMLHFLHAVANDRERVTPSCSARLTSVTRQLQTTTPKSPSR